MKILVVADTQVPEFTESRFDGELTKGVELIISCGDLQPEYLTMLSKQVGVPVYYIMGNHDIRYEVAPPEGCLNIHRQVITYGGVRILGLGGSRWYNGGPHQYHERQMRTFIRKLWFSMLGKNKFDIVVTHAPPRGIGDEEDPCHRGFRCFIGLIQRYSPAYLLHGHIHKLFQADAQRITMVNQTKVINCYGYYVFEFEQHL